jgi:hypothetical protein
MKMLIEYLGSFESLNKDAGFQLLKDISEGDVKTLGRRQRSLLRFGDMVFYGMSMLRTSSNLFRVKSLKVKN